MSDFHGRFIWYELMTPDLTGARAFYEAVVGWAAKDMPMPGGSYTILEADGAGVAGAMPLTDEVRAQGVPPNWTAYVAVDDVDASAEKTKALGGAVFRPPQDIPGVGRFAIIRDPAGAVIAIMTPTPQDPPRPRAAPGTPGHAGWHELYGGEPEASFAFYSALFGWRKDAAVEMGPMGVYQLFSNPDGQVGGMMRKPPQVPAPAWVYYFNVPDIKAAAGRIADAGGQVVNGPMEVPGGDWIVQAQDPQGAFFAVMARKS